MHIKKRDTSVVKHYVLDTNVLLHDPQSMFQFEDNSVWIPIQVLEELDKFKSESSTRGANAREVHRRLSERFRNAEEMRKGVPLENGGRLHVYIKPTPEWTTRHGDELITESPRWDSVHALFPDFTLADNKILATAAYLSDTQTAPTILVTKDLNLQLKARALGLEAEDYRTDRVEDHDIRRTQRRSGAEDYETAEIPGNRLQAFASEGQLVLEDGPEFLANQYIMLKDPASGHGVPARHIGDGEYRALRHDHLVIRGGRTLQALNLGQRFLLDALFDPDITLMTVYGKAGTGKTLLTVGASLQQVQDGEYEKMLITRVIMPTGRDIGFLPGRMEEKMEPWVQPAYDALEQLLSKPRKPEKFERKKQSSRKSQGPSQPVMSQQNGKSSRPYDSLLEAGLIEIEAITHIRGRSIPRAIFIVDEAQQLTPHEAKTLVTRMGKGSKIILIGDLSQIDNPYVDAHTNGLVYTRSRLQGQSFMAHVNLFKGERSEMAEVAANLM